MSDTLRAHLGIRVQVPSEALVPRGYPDQPDDGTWENEGGYVARRKPTAFVMEEPLAPWFPKNVNPPRLLVLDAETAAELELHVARRGLVVREVR